MFDELPYYPEGHVMPCYFQDENRFGVYLLFNEEGIWPALHICQDQNRTGVQTGVNNGAGTGKHSGP